MQVENYSYQASDDVCGTKKPSVRNELRAFSCAKISVYFCEPTCPMPSLKMVPRGGIMPPNLKTR